MNTARANMPHYFASEAKARAIVEAKRQADDRFNEGLADPLLAHFIKQIFPQDDQHEITGGKQV